MRDAAAQGIALLFPDTSPRDAGIESEDVDWDFGSGISSLTLAYPHLTTMGRTGAGFYLNATNPKWSRHYNMLTHVTQELPQVLEAAGLPLVRPSISVSVILFPTC